MEFKLVELEEVSGNKMQILSPLLIENGILKESTMYDEFFLENYDEFPDEVQEIDNRLEVIGKKTGIRHSFYKTNEGKPGDGLVALFDEVESKIRLYAILFGKVAIVLGCGGPKPKSIRAYQEDVNLNRKNELVRLVADILMKAVNDKRIKVTERGLEFDPNEVFTDKE